VLKNQEKSASDRKKEHIELTTKSQLSRWSNDTRFYYEPMIGSHTEEVDLSVDFFGKKLNFPLWVSSMTGGTAEAKNINVNLARACKEFGLGMGLGSCRILLDEPEHLPDFDIRNEMGDQPLFANLGIAQIEKILSSNTWEKVDRMIDMLKADGLIIHVNPMQEWLQPEGDRIGVKPIELIEKSLENAKYPMIVKEVGQGMGPKSLSALMNLPVMIEFAAYGGTNFAKLELNRKNSEDEAYDLLAHIGHNVDEMLAYVNEIIEKSGQGNCRGFILSGGVKNFLDGFYANEKINAPSVYGQASSLLKYARISYEALQKHVAEQIDGYRLAKQFLSVREE
jgi:isopentenyl-diphosphate delta-isomerase